MTRATARVLLCLAASLACAAGARAAGQRDPNSEDTDGLQVGRRPGRRALRRRGARAVRRPGRDHPQLAGRRRRHDPGQAYARAGGGRGGAAQVRGARPRAAQQSRQRDTTCSRRTCLEEIERCATAPRRSDAQIAPHEPVPRHALGAASRAARARRRGTSSPTARDRERAPMPDDSAEDLVRTTNETSRRRNTISRSSGRRLREAEGAVRRATSPRFQGTEADRNRLHGTPPAARSN